MLISALAGREHCLRPKKKLYVNVIVSFSFGDAKVYTLEGLSAEYYLWITKDMSSHTGARAGLLHTPHGTFQTPMFMPVGTREATKLNYDTRSEIIKMAMVLVILSNTYHLFLRPGPELQEEVGGLLYVLLWIGIADSTDSGGFQVFSLGDMRKITEDGVTFRSHIDGSNSFYLPKWLKVQEQLGSDIAMVFDECIPYPADHDYAKLPIGAYHALGASLPRGS